MPWKERVNMAAKEVGAEAEVKARVRTEVARSAGAVEHRLNLQAIGTFPEVRRDRYLVHILLRIPRPVGFVLEVGVFLQIEWTLIR